MQTEKEFTGLCSSCNNLSIHKLSGITNIDQPKIFCEMFESGTDEKIADTIQNSVDELLTSAHNSKLEKAVNYKGLCVNCEKRLDCRLADSEGGVWHCEEYS
jgi:hypothetical protein